MSDIRTITDSGEIERLTSYLFRFKNDSAGSAIAWHKNALDMLTHAFVIQEVTHPKIPDRYVGLYIEKYGEWKHGQYGPGGMCSAHNELGMKWAAWKQEGNEEDIHIHLTDSPDIGGWIREEEGKYHSLFGDIGECSWHPGFVFTLRDMQLGDLWVSVVSDTTEYLLSPKFNTGVWMQRGAHGETEMHESLIEPHFWATPPQGCPVEEVAA